LAVWCGGIAQQRLAIMATMQAIRDLGREIGGRFNPQRVILFGSHARGTAHRDSDVDLLVIMPFRGRSAGKAAEVLMSVSPPFAIDVLVRTPQAVLRRIAMGDCFMRDVVENGIVIYEADRSRVG
jgi:predicted nucleotidyltransferase